MQVLIHRAVTPNQLTVAAFALGLTGAAALATGTYSGLLVGAVLIQTASIVDCADGMLARARNQCTPFGAQLDAALDRLLELFLFAALASALWLGSGNSLLVVVLLGSATLHFVNINLGAITKRGAAAQGNESTAEVRALFLLSVAVFAAADALAFGVWWLLAGELLSCAYVVVAFAKKARASRSAPGKAE